MSVVTDAFVEAAWADIKQRLSLWDVQQPHRSLYRHHFPVIDAHPPKTLGSSTSLPSRRFVVISATEDGVIRREDLRSIVAEMQSGCGEHGGEAPARWSHYWCFVDSSGTVTYFTTEAAVAEFQQ